ncbi:MAG: hypothetical protein WCZ18_12665 [Ottowia sp.]|nr:hypothetical protein [Ottowia sp.]
MQTESRETTSAWWQSPTMWLVVGLTAAAVLASALTIWLATQSQDLIVDDAADAAGALAPAMKARNAVTDRNAVLDRQQKE